MCMFSSPEVSVEKKANNEHRTFRIEEMFQTFTIFI